MSRDRFNDPRDAGLSALYKSHLGEGAADALPSAAADARVRALAVDAVKAGAGRAGVAGGAPRAVTGWRSWIDAAWFKPSLAFATLASLSVIIVALMPRDDIDVERREPPPAAPAPSAAPQSNVQSGPVLRDQSFPDSRGQVSDERRAKLEAEAPARQDAAPQAAPDPQRAQSKGTAREVASAGVAQQPKMKAAQVPEAPPAKMSTQAPQRARIEEPAPATAPRAKVAAPQSSGAVAPAPPPAAVASPPAVVPPSPPPAAAIRAPASPTPPATTLPGLARQQPNPFPAQSGADSARIEKPSNQPPDQAEYRAGAQPLPEVRDSAPTQPNEVQSSIPLPNTYVSPRPHMREGSQGVAAGNALSSSRAPAGMAARKEELMQKRAQEAAPALAAAAPLHRDPAEWIKSILKLRADGKIAEATKELAEFRKHHPAYPLPDELKPLAAAK